jgi:hypothetical protein
MAASSENETLELLLAVFMRELEVLLQYGFKSDNCYMYALRLF